MPLQKAKQFHSSFEVARHIVTEYGWNRCFRGLAPLLCRDVPGYGFYFLSYYYSKWYYLKTFPGKVSETVELQAIALAGSVAGLAGWAFTYPFDVLKTRIQSDFKREKYLSLADCLRKSLAESNNSLLTFYQGLTTTLVRSVPVNIALFCGYELGLYIYAKLKS
jgi:solute carrier family 25 carnitine/acylcarnitine transporter 20/29